jgi:hypothetical protein
MVVAVAASLLTIGAAPASPAPHQSTLAAASTARPPAVAVGTDSGVVTATAAGRLLHRFGVFDTYSLDGRLFAASRLLPEGASAFEEVVGYDAVNGQRQFRIANAFAPVVLDRGRKVAFLPDHDGRRDPQVNSVWLRERDGRIRRIVQFSNGPGLPGVDTGFQGEAGLLWVVFDARGRTMAVAEGNDVDLFIYDVWVVDVATGKARRMTTGKRSRWPSLTSNGRHLAVLRERVDCGGPGAGFRAGDIQTMGTDGSDHRTLTHGTCARFFTDPKWASDRQLLAARLTRTGPARYRSDLVAIDARSGQVSVVTRAGDMVFFGVSPALHQVAYVRGSQPGFFLLDLRTGRTRRFAEGFDPRLAGNHQAF